MWFWVFMCISSLLTPCLLFGFGVWFQKNPPKEINAVFGYRTKMSMQNKDTWVFAHHYCGRLWIRAGKCLLAATAMIMLLLWGKNEKVVGWSGALLMIGQTIVLILPVIWTERALHKTFHTDGSRKSVHTTQDMDSGVLKK